MSESPSTTLQDRRWNALQHGRRSRSTLLPGDDPAEFEALRRELYATYRPLTRPEERCVERMARCEWRMERWERWEQRFNGTLDALLSEEADGPTSQRVNPDAHHWQHRSEDCTKQEMRFERSSLRNERRLLALQQMRRHRLIAGVGAERPATAMPEAAERAEAVEAVPVRPAPAPVGAAVADHASAPAPAAASPVAGLSGQEPAAPTLPAMDCFSGLIKDVDHQKEAPARLSGAVPSPWGQGVENPGAAPERWVVVRPWEPSCGVARGGMAPDGVSSPIPWVPLRVSADVSSGADSSGVPSMLEGGNRLPH